MKELLAQRVSKMVERRLASTHVVDSRLSYNALSNLAQRYDWKSRYLTAAELRIFSQNGEDGVLAELFHLVGTRHKFFVEFGIEAGIEGNAVLLADVLGWSGLFMEGDSYFFSELERKYANRQDVSTRHAYVTPENLEQLLLEEGVPSEPDLLSIDVDGADLFLWSALSRFKPRVVVIEYNSALAWDTRQVVAPDPDGGRRWGGSDYFGCSLGALLQVADEKGYTLVHLEMAGVNAFFVRDDLVDKLPEINLLRRSPNYSLAGRRHPEDQEARRYLNLEERRYEP